MFFMMSHRISGSTFGITTFQIHRSGAEYSRASPVPGIKPGSNALTVIPSGSRGASPYVKYTFASLEVEYRRPRSAFAS